MKSFEFEYQINPVSTNHYWEVSCINGKPVVRKGKAGINFRDFIEWSTLSQCKKKGIKTSFPLIKKPLKVSIAIEYCYQKRPKDIDNILKALFDALEGILFQNDSQIYELYVRKRHCEKHLLKIKVSEMED